MDSLRYQSVKAIFMEACERTGGDRSSYVADACGTDQELRSAVEELLQHDSGAADPLDSARLRNRLAEAAGAGIPNGASAAMPEQIGRYRLLRRLGEGGMGVVYQAQQEMPRRLVALKVIASGLATASMLRRFEHETHLLGRLQHPGIAQIFEAGTFDSVFGRQPYFAMEFVDGQPMLNYLDQRELSIRQRVALFARICDAVEHAHQKGVIHRDLKPANILVVDETAPSATAQAGDALHLAQPKILDFGIARASGGDTAAGTAQTAAGQLIGTLSNMSPEQARGDTAAIDTRSDVYSLGVILHQMLTGGFPYPVDGSIPHVVQTITQTEPARTSRLNRHVDDELDTIILKCLKKEPSRRYQSAGELARDVRHYLAGQAIEAKSDSRAYLLRKTLKRNWIPAAIAAAFVTVITAGLIASVTQWRSAVRERDQKETQRAKAESINTVLHNMLASANPEVSQGREVTVAQVLDQAAGEVQAGSLREHPDVETSVRLTLGEAYLALGKLEPAETHLQAALALCDQTGGRNQFDAALCLAALGRLRHLQSSYEQAAAHLQESLAVVRATKSEARPQTPAIMLSLATALFNAERRDESLAMYDEALALVIRQRGPNHPEVARIKIDIATRTMGAEGGVDLLREELEINRSTLGPKHPEVARTLRRLAAQLHVKGQIDEAERTYLDAIELSHEIYGEDHPEIINIVKNLAWLYEHSEQRQKIVPLLRRHLHAAETVFGQQSVNYADYETTLATALFDQHGFDQAEVLTRHALSTLKDIGGSQTWRVAQCQNLLARMLMSRAEYDEAERLLRASVEINDDASEKDDLHRSQAQSLLGELLTIRGEFAQAEPLLLQGYEGLAPRKSMPTFRQKAIERLMRLYEQWEQAEPDAGKAEQADLWRSRLQESQ